MADTAAEALELLLGDDDLTAARRLVVSLGQREGVTSCRLVVPEEGVLAHADPSKIDLVSLPERWPASAASAEDAAPGLTRVAVLIPGRGTAFLELAATPADAGLLLPPRQQVSLGAVGASGMLLSLLVYRKLRERLVAITLVRSALQSLAEGTPPGANLRVAAGGPEAEAWNELLATFSDHRERKLLDAVEEATHRGPQSGGDVAAACDSLTSGMVILREDGRVDYANGAACVMLQRDRDEVVNHPLEVLLRSDEAKAAFHEAINGSSRRGNFEQREPESDTVIRFTLRPLRRDDAGGTLVTLEDVTQQRAADAARNSFVATATHELRTPLTNIRLYLETAIDEGEKDETIRAQCFNVMNSETRRLERLVGEMLSVAEIEAGSMQLRRNELRMDRVMADLEKDYKAQAEEKKIELKFDVAPKLPAVDADPDKLQVAMHNLLGNALKYTPEGGTVTVTAEADETQFVMKVQDTGLGIDEAEKESVFERFYRSHNPKVAKIPGTGLGLALSREVVRLHGGDITLDSVLNEGSTFSLTLPI